MNGAPPSQGQSGPVGIPLSDLAKIYGGANAVDHNDPAFQSPKDPLDDKTKARSGLVYRDLPLVTIQNAWTVDQARAALYAHIQGQFETSAQLWESILGDDRVTATLGSRNAGLFGREVRFKPANDSPEAAECLAAWKAWWPRLAGDSAMTEINTYAIGMGFCPAQLVWDTSGEIWGPYLRPWAPRYTYFHWPLRKLIALSQDGPIVVEPGDAKWFLHSPYGQYRGWIRGAIRAVTEPWMLRHFAFRDMARFSEIHGLPTRVGLVPAVSDPGERAAFERSLASLGSDTAMILPQGVDGQQGSGYDYKLVEAKDRAWEVFGGLIEKCDTAIVLSLLFQNLTTEVTGGSFAATSAHMDIRQSGLQFDNDAWRNSIYEQVARPFAWLNYGDADLAPTTDRDVEPRDDLELAGKQFSAFSLALQAMKSAGIDLSSAAMAAVAAKMGIPLTETDLVRPPAEAQVFKYHMDYGTLTTNEIRDRLGLPPMTDGDAPPKPLVAPSGGEP